jgi:hypothetical protein
LEVGLNEWQYEVRSRKWRIYTMGDKKYSTMKNRHKQRARVSRTVVPAAACALVFAGGHLEVRFCSVGTYRPPPPLGSHPGAPRGYEATLSAGTVLHCSACGGLRSLSTLPLPLWGIRTIHRGPPPTRGGASACRTQQAGWCNSPVYRVSVDPAWFAHNQPTDRGRTPALHHLEE